MVLQQQPASACLYGTVGDPGGSVRISIRSSSESSGFAANVSTGGGWKACLPPTAAGGDYTVTATCTGCTNTTAAVLEHVTFGDVWYCSGESIKPLHAVSLSRWFSLRMRGRG